MVAGLTCVQPTNICEVNNCENICYAACRDLFQDGMLLAGAWNAKSFAFLSWVVAGLTNVQPTNICEMNTMLLAGTCSMTGCCSQGFGMRRFWLFCLGWLQV